MRTVFVSRSPLRQTLVLAATVIGCFSIVLAAAIGTISAFGPSHQFFFPGFGFVLGFFWSWGVLPQLAVQAFLPCYPISRLHRSISRRALARSTTVIGCELIKDVKPALGRIGWVVRVKLQSGDSFELHASFNPWSKKVGQLERILLRLRSLALANKLAIETMSSTSGLAGDLTRPHSIL